MLLDFFYSHITGTYTGHGSVSGLCRFATLLVISTIVTGNVGAEQQVIKVSQVAWSGLVAPEREAIQQKYVVSLLESGSFGVIIDNQGINESAPGTAGGALLGAAVGNAAYIDNALKNGNYSAKTQLASGLLGAVVGSMLDSKPTAQFHFRYAVRLGSGDIQYFDHVKGDAFRHPAGICVSVPSLAPIEQQLCTQTTATLRTQYLQGIADDGIFPPPPPGAPPPTPSLGRERLAVTNIQIGETVWVEPGPLPAFSSPKVGPSRLPELPGGTPLEVVFLVKDFAKVRTPSSTLVWIEKKGVVSNPPAQPSTYRRFPPSTLPHSAANVQGEVYVASDTINCKLGTNPPVRTTVEKCKLINGSPVE